MSASSFFHRMQTLGSLRLICFVTEIFPIFLFQFYFFVTHQCNGCAHLVYQKHPWFFSITSNGFLDSWIKSNEISQVLEAWRKSGHPGHLRP